MLENNTNNLTQEQKDLIPFYHEKWTKKAFLTHPIDQEKAKATIQQTYNIIGYNQPAEIVFVESPLAANNLLVNLLFKKINHLWQHNSQKFTYNLGIYIYELQSFYGNLIKLIIQKKIIDLRLDYQIKNKLGLQVEIERNLRVLFRLFDELMIKIGTKISSKIQALNLADVNSLIPLCTFQSFRPEKFVIDACQLDYAISVLGCSHEREKWEVLQALINECGWVYFLPEICIVCDRPRKILFDNLNRPHAEGEAALEFTDGLAVYAHHGVILPEKYGKIPPELWQPSWLLKEQNVELKRILIENIGYARICHELEATELDSWREYTLLRINTNIDVEPIFLLKMTCPSTRHIHALRVPPEIQSAREAIRWVNWGIDPEEFSVAT